MSKLSYKTLFIIFFFLLIGVIVLSKFALPNQKVSAAWWNDMWNYRKAISIANTSGSNLTDFQVSLSVGTSALIASGKMQSDCDDIRITDINGNLLPYWIEENNPGCNQITDTKIWVKASSLPTSGSIVYIYYGNASATNNQNGNNVFEFFDDFENGTSKWTFEVGVTSSIVTESTSKILALSTPSNFLGAFAGNETMNNYYVESRLKTSDRRVGLYARHKSSNNTDNGYYIRVEADNFGYSQDNGGLGIYGSSVLNSNTWYNMKILAVGTSASLFLNDVNQNINQVFQNTTGNIGISPIETALTYFDYVFVRKYASADPAPTLQSEETGTAPIAYWKFDEGIGTTAFDSTSNRNNGTISGATWQTEDQCISGKCLKFNGSNNYVSIADSNQIDFTNAITMSAWIKLNSYTAGGANTDRGAIMIKAYSYYMSITASTGKLSSYFYGVDGNHRDSNSQIPLNQWAYVAITYDGSNIKWYINGKLDKTFAASGNITSGTTPLNIGMENTTYGRAFNGSIDESKIYPYARTAAQIKLDYNAGKAHSSSTEGTSTSMGSNKNNNSLSDGLVGYWKMDEGVGTTTTDSSGNSNTGTLSGTSWASGKYGIGNSFNGSSSYINCGNNTNLNNMNSITIGAWVKTSYSAQVQSIVEKRENTDPYQGYGFSIGTDGKLVLRGGSNISTVAGNTVMTDGNWHYVVAVFSTISKIYLDGKDDTSTTVDYSNYNFTNTNDLFIGKSRTVSWYFNGLIDEVRIYNRALSPAEVSNLYNYAPGPIGYWDFEEATGTVVKDKSGNNNSGTWNGTLGNQWINGKYGKAGNFNGSDNYIETTINSSLDTQTQLTLSAWINRKSNSQDWESIANHLNKSSPYDGYSISSMANGKIRAFIGLYTTNYIDTTNAISNNTWHYVSLVSNGTTFAIYVDGLKASADQNIGTISTTGVTARIGKSISSGEYFDGFIDDVKIYNYARTQKQIIEDMGNGAPATSAKSVVAYYKFDEGNGTIVNNSGNGGIGLSGVFGTGNSAPTWTTGKIGKALSFNGSTNYINFGNNSSTQNDAAITITTWIKKNNSTGSQTIVSQGGGNCPPYYMYQFKTDTDKLEMKLFGPDSYYYYTFPNAIVSNNIWQHVAIVINDGTTSTDTGTATVYIDSVNKGSTTWTGNRMKASGKNLYIGSNNWSCNIPTDFFNGLIDELKIYNYALTPDEVKQDYNKGSSLQMGQTFQTIGATTTSLEYCIPGDNSYCASPVAEWNFEENTGNTTKDISGNNNTGTFGTGNSAPTWTLGVKNKGAGLNFSGKQFITIADNATLKPTTAITAEAWFNTTDKTTSQRIISKTEGSGYQLSLNENSGCPSNTLCFLININGTYYSAAYASSNLSNNTWYHITGLYDGSTVKLFLNGSNIGTTSTVSNAITQGAFPLCIGSEPGSTCQDGGGLLFSGKIDGVKIYNYARTPAQIAYDYNKGAPIGWWKFDECQGNIANDSSGIGNTGSINIGASGTQNSLGTCQVGTSAAWTSGASGKINSSLNFDGNDDYVNAGNIGTTLTSMTISLWSKTSTNNRLQTLASKWGTSSQARFSWLLFTNLWGADGHIDFLTSSTGTSYARAQTPSNTIIANKWQNIVGVYTGSSMYIYVDGILKGTQNSGVPTSLRSVSTPLTIGADWDTGAAGDVLYRTFSGQIDDVRIYNYALTAEQIKVLYNGGGTSFN